MTRVSILTYPRYSLSDFSSSLGGGFAPFPLRPYFPVSPLLQFLSFCCSRPSVAAARFHPH